MKERGSARLEKAALHKLVDERADAAAGLLGAGDDGVDFGAVGKGHVAAPGSARIRSSIPAKNGFAGGNVLLRKSAMPS